MQGSRSIIRKNRKLSTEPVVLTLNPMIDMFTNLLVFLIINFRVTTIDVPPDPNLTLPFSQSENQAQMATQVVISKKAIAVEGEEVVTVNQGRVSDRDKRGMIISALSRALERRRDKTEYIEKRNPTVKFEGTVLLMADKDTSYRLLNEVMYTAGKLGFLNFVFLAYQKES